MPRPLGDLFVILDKHRQMCAMNRGRLAEDLAQILAEEVKASMDAEQSFDGTGWDELSERYSEWKGERFPGRRSIHARSDDPSPPPATWPPPRRDANHPEPASPGTRPSG